MAKRILLGLAIVVVVVLVVLGAGYYFLTRQLALLPVPPVSTPSPAPTATPTPSAIATPDIPNPTPPPTLQPVPTPSPVPTPTPTPSVSAGPTPTPQPEKVRIELTQEQVNAKLKDLMVQYKDKLPLQAENPVIRLRPGKVEAEADVLLSGFRIRVTGEGRIEIEDGKPKIIVDKVRVGDMPLPPAFQQAVTSRIPSSAMLPVDIPMEVTSITILEGKVIIEGIPK